MPSFVKQRPSSPPWLANRLIKLTVPSDHADGLLGDLYEEYEERFVHSPFDARRWFWQQSLSSAYGYVKAACRHPIILQTVLFLFATTAFISLCLLVLWLSKMDHLNDFSAGFWHKLLDGKIHLALLEPAFWRGVPEYVSLNDGHGLFNTLAMFINVPALFIAIVSIGVMYLVCRNHRQSVLSVILVGFGLMLAPYIIGFAMLSSHNYEATKVGPILAVMLLSFLYMLVPISWLINKRLRARDTGR